MQRLSKIFPYDYTNTLYYAFIQPYIDYALSVWGNTSQRNLYKVQRLQCRVARIMTNNFDYNIPGITIVKQLGWQNISERNQK